jgi:hypothetical protein
LNRTGYLIIGFVGVTFLLGLQLKQVVYGRSLIENISSGNGSMIRDNTNESLAEQVVDSKSLMLGIPDRDEENNTVGQMINECGIIKPSSGMEESDEMAECQKRILNETDTSTATTGRKER